MNIVLITAGGLGERFGKEEPKQFCMVVDKPLIIHTMEKFEQHSEIDVIAVSCLEGWEDRVWEYAREFGIHKLRHVVTGGATNQESICNGVAEIQKHYEADAVVLIHDAARPLVTTDIITDCLRVVEKHGNAVASIPCLEPLLIENKGGVSAREYYPRHGLRRAQAPQGFKLGKLVWAHQCAKEQGIENTTASNVLMQILGEEIFFSQSSTNNIKITTPDDKRFMEAWLYREAQTQQGI